MRFFATGLLAAALSTLSAAPASAATMIYTATGAANGFTASDGFSGPFSVTAMADPATKQQCVGPGGPIANCNFVVNSSLTINVTGLGSFVVGTPTITVLNTAANFFGFTQVNFGGPTPTRLLMGLNVAGPGPTSPAFALWDLVSDFGPIMTNSIVPQTNLPPSFQHIPIATNGGAIFVTQSPPTISTFSAKLISNAVPEPSTWMMLIVGFGFIGMALRQRARLAFG